MICLGIPLDMQLSPKATIGKPYRRAELPGLCQLQHCVVGKHTGHSTSINRQLCFVLRMLGDMRGLKKGTPLLEKWVQVRKAGVLT